MGGGEQEQYTNLLTQVKSRIDLATASLSAPPTISQIEMAALNVRKSIELVVLGSLVTNHRYIKSISDAFHRKDWNEARKIVRQVNPHYWPVPSVRVGSGEGPIVLQQVTEGHLTESQAARAFGLTSRLLHAANPYGPELDWQEAADKLKEVVRALVRLLDHHEVRLAESRYMAIGQMHTAPDGLVSVALFEMLPAQEIPTS